MAKQRIRTLTTIIRKKVIRTFAHSILPEDASLMLSGILASQQMKGCPQRLIVGSATHSFAKDIHCISHMPNAMQGKQQKAQ